MFGIRLQIVDSSEVFCTSLKEFLSNTMEVAVCLDGSCAIAQICDFRPDILVLAASLPGNDGFHILQTVQNAGIRPMVLMILPYISEYISRRAADLKVDHVMCIPCDLGAVFACIDYFQDTIVGRRDPLTTSIRNLLLDMGFRTNLCGYRYLVSALSILIAHPEQSLTKELYPYVAKEHKGSWQQIEHGIRLSIGDAWENRNNDVWKRYFSEEKGKPTNSVFLTRIAQLLQGTGQNIYSEVL